MFSRLTTAFLVLATCAATVNAAINFSGASWIWSSDAVPGHTVNFPAQSRAFRKDFILSPTKIPTSVEVIIAGDDAYALYINGATVGGGSDWTHPNYFCFKPVNSTTVYGQRVVIAVAVNNVVPNSLLAKVKVTYLGGTSDQFVIDHSWVSSLGVPVGVQSKDYNDSAWAPAVVEVFYESEFSGFLSPAPQNQVCQ